MPPEPVVSVPSDVTVPPVQVAVVHSEKLTSMTPVPASAAVARTVNGSAAAAFTYGPAGAVTFTAGAWLSTVTFVFVVLVTLPAQSVTVALTSYWPSATASGPVFVFQLAGTVCQLVVPAGATFQTIVGVGSASVVDAVSATVSAAPPFVAGTVIVTPGAVLSTRAFEIGVEVATL